MYHHQSCSVLISSLPLLHSYCIHCSRCVPKRHKLIDKEAFVQIQTRIQYAVAMVDQYPRAANSKILLEVIAQQHNEPSRDSLMEPSGQDDFQHAANWDAVIQYVDSFDANGVSGQNLLVK